MKRYILTITLLLISSLIYSGEEYVVATNIDNHTEILIKAHFLQKSGFERWDNGVEVTTLDTKDKNPGKRVFIEKILKMNMGSYINYWAQERAKGRSINALILSTDEEVLRFLKSEKGAIGYLPKKMAKEVRIIQEFSVE